MIPKGVNMKFLLEKYRVLSIWMSLLILALAFVVGSDDEWRPVCAVLAFLIGGLMYGLGGIREWTRGHRISSMVETFLAVCMWIALVLSLLRLGGIL